MPRTSSRTSLLLLGALLLMTACSDSPTGDDDNTPPAGMPAPHVQGNRLVDQNGQLLRLRGVNRSGTEFACIQGWGIFDGRVDAAAISAIAGWNANVVRVPLNESCWLALPGTHDAWSGTHYQDSIAALVRRINGAGMMAILELHWTGLSGDYHVAQQPMPNRAHTPEFWRQVANAYKNNSAIIFDLFNEPYPDANTDTDEAWRCWRDGGTCRNITYEAAGMQELVNAVRATGAQNVIMLGGVNYAAHLSQWLTHKPTDPLNNLAASWHVYNFSACSTRACWDSDAAPVAQQVPLVLGELGQSDGGTNFVIALLDWMDNRQGSYLAWMWNTWNDPLALISDYNGTPTPYGQVFRSRFNSQ